jgi:hypothetical protein
MNNGVYEMDSCIIKDNGSGGVVAKGSKVTLPNCLLVRGNVETETGVDSRASVGVLCLEASDVELQNCTLSEFKTAVVVENGSRIKIFQCVFSECETPLSLAGESTQTLASDRKAYAVKEFDSAAPDSPFNVDEFSTKHRVDAGSAAAVKEIKGLSNLRMEICPARTSTRKKWDSALSRPNAFFRSLTFL